MLDTLVDIVSKKIKMHQQIELHCEINQDIGNLHRASRVLGSNLRGKHYNVFLPLPYVNAVMSQNQHVEKFELSWRDKVGL